MGCKCAEGKAKMKEAYYFSHDSNAKDDPKCVLLIEQLGLEGYGIYWVLIEVLRDQSSYKYPVALLPSLSRKYNTTFEKMKTVVYNYGLFTVDENDFFSLSLMERMESYEHKRLMASKAGKRSAEIRLLGANATNYQQSFNGCSTDVQPNKANEIKEKDNKSNLEIAIDDFVEFRKKIKATMTEKAILLMKKELDRLASDDETKIEIINQSILNGWKGVFALRNPQACVSKKEKFADEAWGNK